MWTFPCYDKVKKQALIVPTLEHRIDQIYPNPRAPTNYAGEPFHDDAWCTRTMHSGIHPMKEVAQRLRAHRALLLNWFRAKGSYALGRVEGFNNKDKVVTRRPYGVRTYDGLKKSLYQTLGDLPTPKATHRLC